MYSPKKKKTKECIFAGTKRALVIYHAKVSNYFWSIRK